MALGKWIIGGVALVAIGNGCTPLVKYQAEVLYHEGDQTASYLGEMTTYDNCINEAIWKYNDLNKDDDERAFSWICLQWAGSNIVRKVR